MNTLRKQYNELLIREQKAEEYFKTVDPKETDKWLPQFQEIIIKLSRLIYQIQKEEGRELTKSEIFEGFKEGVRN